MGGCGRTGSEPLALELKRPADHRRPASGGGSDAGLAVLSAGQLGRAVALLPAVEIQGQTSRRSPTDTCLATAKEGGDVQIVEVKAVRLEGLNSRFRLNFIRLICGSRPAA